MLSRSVEGCGLCFSLAALENDKLFGRASRTMNSKNVKCIRELSHDDHPKMMNEIEDIISELFGSIQTILMSE